MWLLSDYKVLPYDGSWLNQPTLVQRDFRRYMLVKRWHEMNEKRKKPAANKYQMEG